MRTLLHEKEHVIESKQAKAKAELREKQLSEALDDRIQFMERQLESPLNALINQRERMYLDEIPALQLESPLNALINRRERLTVREADDLQMENLLYAQINQCEQKRVSELPPQLASPIHALINGHKQRRFWRTPR